MMTELQMFMSDSHRDSQSTLEGRIWGFRDISGALGPIPKILVQRPVLSLG